MLNVESELREDSESSRLDSDSDVDKCRLKSSLLDCHHWQGGGYC